jgi:hypothetical protein
MIAGPGVARVAWYAWCAFLPCVARLCPVIVSRDAGMRGACGSPPAARGHHQGTTGTRVWRGIGLPVLGENGKSLGTVLSAPAPPLHRPCTAPAPPLTASRQWCDPQSRPTQCDGSPSRASSGSRPGGASRCTARRTRIRHGRDTPPQDSAAGGQGLCQWVKFFLKFS